MKNAAVNATTAIADGVSSLLGGSKVKRLEAENENLRQDIAYRCLLYTSDAADE